MRAKWGATNDGLLTAASAEVIGDAGAYNYTSNKVLGNAQLTVTGPYEIDNVHVDTYTVYTNNIPVRRFPRFRRAPGPFRRRRPDESAGGRLEHGSAWRSA